MSKQSDKQKRLHEQALRAGRQAQQEMDMGKSTKSIKDHTPEEFNIFLNGGGGPERPRRGLTKIEAKRIDHLSKLAQSCASEVDLYIAEVCSEHHVTQVKLDDLPQKARDEIVDLKNRLELVNAKLKKFVIDLRSECGMPYNAKLHGTTWVDGTTGKPLIPSDQ